MVGVTVVLRGTAQSGHVCYIVALIDYFLVSGTYKLAVFSCLLLVLLFLFLLFVFVSLFRFVVLFVCCYVFVLVCIFCVIFLYSSPVLFVF